MVQQGPADSRRVIAGLLIHGICRGVAVALLALALYVALTNWHGGGSTWGLRYAAIALVVYALGRGLQQWLAGR